MGPVKPLIRSSSARNVLLPNFILRVLAVAQVSAWAFGFHAPLFDMARVQQTPATWGTGTKGRGLPPVHVLPVSRAEGWTAGRYRGFEAGGRRWGSKRFSPLSMGKEAKDPEVALKSVKVGPLKQENINLPSGVSMQAVCQKPSTGSPKRSKQLPPLVFIHGSYHAAWCWAEHWMSFLASKGYETYSISLRGTSGTPIPTVEGDAVGVKIKIADHVADVRSFAETVLPGRRPVFVSHSFGGLVVLKLMEALDKESEAADGGGDGQGSESAEAIKTKMAGVAFLCSVPPSGNGPMTKRFMKERPVMTIKLVLGFVLKMAVSWRWLARDLFFCQSLEQTALNRYMANFQADSKNGLDLNDLQVPMKYADNEGRAKWLQAAPPRLVMGAERDRIVDEAGVKEMATFLDTEHIMLPTVPHDVMLGPDWPVGVTRLLQWLETTDFTLSSTP
eukprot:jgi/Undpi1/14248/HiC_scaffold_9.g03897.m1